MASATGCVMIAAGEFEDLSAARACIADSFAMEKSAEKEKPMMTGYGSVAKVRHLAWTQRPRDRAVEKAPVISGTLQLDDDRI